MSLYLHLKSFCARGKWPAARQLPAEGRAPLLPNSALNCVSAYSFSYWGQAGSHQSFTAEFLTLSPQDAAVLASSCQRACQPRGRRSKTGFKPLTHSSQCDSKPSLRHRGPIPNTHSLPFKFTCAKLLSSHGLEKPSSHWQFGEDSRTLAPKLEDVGMDTHWRGVDSWQQSWLWSPKQKCLILTVK